MAAITIVATDIRSALVGQDFTVTATVYEDGTASDIGTITLGITDANGDEVVASGTAVSSDGGDGTYTYDVSSVPEPNLLVVTWTEAGGTTATTYVDVQGSYLFHENQLRNFDDEAISDTTTYSDSDIARTHQRVVEYMEAYTGRSWVRRYNRLLAPGSGSRMLDLSAGGVNRTSTGLHLNRPGCFEDTIQVIRANDGADVTTSDIVIHPGGLLQRTDDAWTQATSDDPLNVTVEYEYGQPFPVDGADRVGMIIARHWLVSSRVPDTASSWTDQLGSSYSFDESRLPWEAYSWLRNHKIRGYFA